MIFRDGKTKSCPWEEVLIYALVTIISDPKNDDDINWQATYSHHIEILKTLTFGQLFDAIDDFFTSWIRLVCQYSIIVPSIKLWSLFERTTLGMKFKKWWIKQLFAWDKWSQKNK